MKRREFIRGATAVGVVAGSSSLQDPLVTGPVPRRKRARGQPEALELDAVIAEKTKIVRTGDFDWPVLDMGQGRPVLLLHGFPDSRYLWRYLVTDLVDSGFRVLAPDLRGFGDAPKPLDVEGYVIPNVMRDVIGLLDGLQVERFCLVGHDWGAVVAWFLAAYSPQRVEKLAALSVGCPGTSGFLTFEHLKLAWYAFLFKCAEDVEQLVRANDWEFFRRLTGGNGDQARYLEDLSRPGALAAALNWYRANIVLKFGPANPFSLPRIGCPVLGVWSDGDAYLTEGSMLSSPENIDGGWRYRKITGASHWMMLEKPKEVVRILTGFLAG